MGNVKYLSSKSFDKLPFELENLDLKASHTNNVTQDQDNPEVSGILKGTNVKQRLEKVAQGPHFRARERQLAKSALEYIEILERREPYHWTERARMALLKEVNQRVIGKQAAVKIDSFLKRHRLRRS